MTLLSAPSPTICPSCTARDVEDDGDYCATCTEALSPSSPVDELARRREAETEKKRRYRAGLAAKGLTTRQRKTDVA